MITQELLEHIRHQRQNGTSDEDIRNALRANGWTEEHVQEALGGVVPHPQEATSNGGKLPGPIVLLKESLHIFKTRFWTMFGISVVPFLVILPVIAVIGISATLGLLIPQLVEGLGAGLIILVILGILIFLCAVVLWTWAQVALLYAIKDRKESIGFKEAFRRGWKMLRAWWWLAILSGFIILGGLFLFVIPGILFAVWFCLATYILVTENIRGMDALMKSREYVRGMWWSIAWRMLCLFIIWILISVVLSIFKLGSDASNTIQSILDLFLTPIFTIYLFLIYERLRAIKGEHVQPQSKKGRFIAVGIFGVIVIPLLIVFAVFLVGSGGSVARDAMRIADLNQLRSAAELYYSDYGAYPASLDETREYLGEVPTDPSTNQPYAYTLNPVTKNYELCAETESKGKQCLQGIAE